MTFEGLTFYLVGWIGIGFIIYMIIVIDANFETPDYLEHLSRSKRILCKLGLFFLWPIWLPLFILLGMVLLIMQSWIDEYLERRKLSSDKDQFEIEY